MSNAALISAPRNFNRMKKSRAAGRILRRAGLHKCACGKRSYRTERKARVALDAIRSNEQSRQAALGQTGSVERKYYPCRHCPGVYHLTSQE